MYAKALRTNARRDAPWQIAKYGVGIA